MSSQTVETGNSDSEPPHDGYRIIDQRTDKDVDGFDEDEWETLRRLFEEARRPAEFIDSDGNSEMVH